MWKRASTDTTHKSISPHRQRYHKQTLMNNCSISPMLACRGSVSLFTQSAIELLPPQARTHNSIQQHRLFLRPSSKKKDPCPLFACTTPIYLIRWNGSSKDQLVGTDLPLQPVFLWHNTPDASAYNINIKYSKYQHIIQRIFFKGKKDVIIQHCNQNPNIDVLYMGACVGIFPLMFELCKGILKAKTSVG